MSATRRTYDIIVWGCTGFTGKYVVKYLHESYPDLRFALGGRNVAKLEEIKKDLNLRSSIGIVTADIQDPASLDKMISDTNVLIATAGPFAKIGTNIVASCIRSKTHYCDITGEAQWIRTVIDDFGKSAEQSGVKIINCCGFDCIPSDMGTFMVVNGLKKKGFTPQEARLVVHSVKGGASGGTIASVMNMFSSSSFAALLALMNPFYLAPRDETTKALTGPTDRFATVRAMDNNVMGYDSVFKTWTMPYVMQYIDTRIVNRSNAISGWAYGRNFVYGERMRAPNVLVALLVTMVMPAMALLLLNPITRAILKWVVPEQGQGPSEDDVENGHFKLKFWARGTDASGNVGTVKGGVTALNGDPGYKQTAKMISEAALCLVHDKDKLPAAVGILTPSVALGGALIARLQARGMDFFFEDAPYVP